MSYNQQLKKDLFKLVVSNPDFIHNMLKYELPLPLDIKDDNNNTLLNKFIIENNLKCANLLLDNIKNNVYNSKLKDILLNTQNDDGNAPIHLAVMNNQQEIAKKLYKLGVDLSKPNNEDFVVEYTDTDTKKPLNRRQLNKKPQNEMQNILEQLSMPVNQQIIIPEILGTITSTEIINNFDNQPRMQIQAPQRNQQMNEFDFLKNFLNKNSNEPLMLTEVSDINSIDTNEFIKYLRDNKLQTGGNNDTSINTNEFIKYISQQNIQNGGTDVKSISGVRKIKNTIQNSETDKTQSINDTLDIADLIKTQRGGARQIKPFRLGHKATSKESSKKSSRSLSKNRKSRRNKKSSRSLSKNRKSRRNKKSSSRSLSRSLSRPSSDLHQDVIDYLIKNYSLSDDDARYIKAGLYHMIKEKFANLSNMQRALKLKEMAMDQEEVKKMTKQLPQLKEIVTKAREQKQKEKETSSKNPKETKSKKETKPKKEIKPKKETKAKK